MSNSSHALKSWGHQTIKNMSLFLSSEVGMILEGKYFALTTNAWTSIAKTGYVTCTAHFIDKDTWVLHNIVLGLFEKTGWSRAVDCMEYVENQMELYNLHYSCFCSD